LGISEVAGSNRGPWRAATAYRGGAETAARITRPHPATEAAGVHSASAAMEASSTTAVETSAAMEPAASATLRHRGSCNRKRRRDRQRTYHFQICHFDSPKLDLDQTAGGFHRSSIAECSRLFEPAECGQFGALTFSRRKQKRGAEAPRFFQ